MRYAIISDIHSNLYALKAVLLDAQCIGVDKIICLGDLVGYGPHPEEVIDLAYRKIDHFVMGNHDAVICKKISDSSFNSNAKTAIRWTSSVLDEQAVNFLKKQPYVIESKTFKCVHGDLTAPKEFRYILNIDDAINNFEQTTTPITFIGHSHYPGTYIAFKDTIELSYDQEFKLSQKKKYIVNVGSVGLPRDNDSRACYCIFDELDYSIKMRRVPFDIESFKQDLDKHNLSENSFHFLNIVEDQTKADLRDGMDYIPSGTSKIKPIKNVININEGKRQKSFKRPSILTMGIIIFLLISILSFNMVAESQKHKQWILCTNEQPVTPDFIIGKDLLPNPDFTGNITRKNRLNDYSIFTETENQTIKLISDEDIPVWIINSLKPGFFQINSRQLIAPKGIRFSASFSYQGSDLLESTNLELKIYALVNGVEEILCRKKLLVESEKERWSYRSLTMPKAENGLMEESKVYLSISGKVKGSLKIRNLQLTCRDIH